MPTYETTGTATVTIAREDMPGKSAVILVPFDYRLVTRDKLCFWTELVELGYIGTARKIDSEHIEVIAIGNGLRYGEDVRVSDPDRAAISLRRFAMHYTTVA